MAHKQIRPWSHAECRHRAQMPLPAVAEVAPRRLDGLTPSLRAPRQLDRHDPQPPQRLIRMRQRLLTRPVIVAILVRLGWRRGPSLAEVQTVLAREGRLGGAPLQVSAQASTTRLAVLPAAVVGPLLAAVCARRHAHAPPALPPPSGEPVRQHVARLALVHGSTLEALRNKTQVLRERTGVVLGGKMMVMVEAFSHRPWGRGLPTTRPRMTSALRRRGWRPCRSAACWGVSWDGSGFCGVTTSPRPLASW